MIAAAYQVQKVLVASSWSNDSSSRSAEPLDGIPHKALIQVLKCIDIQERLSSCALVCHSWNAAAAAATSMSRLIATESNRGTLQKWLYRHAKQMTSGIDIAASAGQRVSGFTLPLPGLRAKLNPFAQSKQRWMGLQLPLLQLQGLQSMQLSGLQLVRHASSTAAAADSKAVAAMLAEAEALEAAAAAGAEVCGTATSLAALTSLTALQLHDAKLCGCNNGVCGLWSLASLQHLHLSRQGDSICGAVNMLLPYITSLTSLALTHNEDKSGFSEVRKLTQLRSLQLEPHAGVGKTLHPPSLVTVPAGLTRLEVSSCSAQGDEISRYSIPGLESCTALQCLSLQRVGELEVAVLGQLLQLTRLDVQVHAFNQQHLASLLVVLPSLLHLQELHIHRISMLRGWEWSVNAEAAAKNAVRQHCTALTSLGQLTHLELINIPWLAGIKGGRIFQSGAQLPKLVSLAMCWRDIDFRLDEFGDNYSELFGTEDISSLATCCPALQQLELCEEVRNEADLSGLLRLTGLTQLVIGGEQIGNSTMQQLVQLTGLRSLAVNPAGGMAAIGKYPRSSPMFDDLGLCCLTVLTGLTRLDVFSEGFSKEFGKKHVVLESKVASGSPVHRQLEKRCATSMLRKHKKQQQQQQRLPQQRQQHWQSNGLAVVNDVNSTGEHSPSTGKKAALLRRIEMLKQMLSELEAEVAAL